MKKILMVSALAFAVVAPSFVAMAKDHGGKKGHHNGEKMFERGDTNGDGVISKDEFLKGAEERFNKMDLDGNGEVTKEEAKQAREKMIEKWKEKKANRDANKDSDKDTESTD